MKSVVFGFLLMMLCFGLSGQTKQVELEWQGILTEVLGDDSLQILHFDGAVLSEEIGLLPRYQASFPLTGRTDEGEFTVTLADEVWKIYNTKGFEGEAQIGAEAKIDYRVVSKRKVYSLEVWVTPLRKSEAGLERLSTFSIHVKQNKSLKAKSNSMTPGFADQSLLSSGKWKKVSVTKTGIYKLTYDDLKDMGLSPDNIRLFGYGGPMLDIYYKNNTYDDLVENAVFYNDGGDGKLDAGDYILFYAHGPEDWNFSVTKQEFIHTTHKYSNKAYYFLSSDHGAGKRMSVAPEVTGEPIVEVSNFTDYAVWEPDVRNVLSSGSEWYSDPFNRDERIEHRFSFEDVITSEKAKVSFSMAARTEDSYSYFKYSLGNVELGNASIANSSKGATGDFAKKSNVSYLENPNGDALDLIVDYTSSDETAAGYINYLRVNVRRKLNLKGSYISFRDEKSIGNGIAKFVIGNSNADVRILDVSERTNPVLVNGAFSNNQTSFNSNTNKVKEFVAFNPNGSFPKPKEEGDVKNQNLHGLSQTDMVIISHPDFMDAAEDLAELHAKDGLKIHIVTPQQIYNEFSSGQTDITAFRWFLKMFYDRASGEADMPRYLLLMGDGTFDIQNRMGENNEKFNFIPTYQSVESLNMSNTYVSDDYFGMLDDNEGDMGNADFVDIGIGRLPVSSVSQAKNIVAKIKYYSENRKRNSWKNTVCFVGDDGDSNTHMRDANRMADKVMREHPEMVVNKIFLDAYQQTTEASGQRCPEAEALVEKSMQQGVLLWNYSGHGGETGLTEEQIMTKTKIKAYENLSNLPVWVTATCEFSRFDLFTETTAGEHVLLSPKGGGVSLFTTTRIVYSSSNYTINNNFFDYVFSRDVKGNPLRLGDICRLSKQPIVRYSVNKRKFLLLGDPALRMNYPTLKVKTESINGLETGAGIMDTISALEALTVKGFIMTESGDTAHDFNGFVYPQVFDKIKNTSTFYNFDKDQSEDQWSPLKFKVWDDLVFTGKSEVINGKFEFTFKLPKEINYEYGNGRIVYYAASDDAEANGYFEDLVIGGFSDDAVADLQGPSLNLFMNHPDFIDGGVVNPDPLLVVELFDENGISTAGSGIGHDIVVMLDEDPGSMEVLNSYYEAIDGNTEGVVKFKFSELSEGEHTLFFRVWDIYNNSTVQTISFVVENDESPDIASLSCYPNPAKDIVEFVFEHDRPETVLEIQVEIFSIKGQKVAVLDAFSYSSSNRIDPIEWDLVGGNGLKVNPGVYLYRTVIKTNGKQSSGVTKKLIVL